MELVRGVNFCRSYVGRVRRARDVNTSGIDPTPSGRDPSALGARSERLTVTGPSWTLDEQRLSFGVRSTSVSGTQPNLHDHRTFIGLKPHVMVDVPELGWCCVKVLIPRHELNERRTKPLFVEGQEGPVTPGRSLRGASADGSRRSGRIDSAVCHVASRRTRPRTNDKKSTPPTSSWQETNTLLEDQLLSSTSFDGGCLAIRKFLLERGTLAGCHASGT